MTISAAHRKRLEAQGFVGLGDDVLSEVGPWLRWSPALCTTIMALGTARASARILLALVPIAVLAAVFPVHPFDLIYNYGIRRWTKTRVLPKNGPPRRFACGVGAVWLTLTAWAFASGSTRLGYILGGSITAAATLACISHFCIPSVIYNWLLGTHETGSMPEEPPRCQRPGT